MAKSLHLVALGCLLGHLSCSSPTGAKGPNPAQLEAQVRYEALIEKFPLDAQGRGAEPSFPGSKEQPMTYGLILMAEVHRYRSNPTPQGAERIRQAFAWLLGHADLDGDGLPGWGLPDAWDAFGDKSVNPANHPYTITTALAVEGLLDVLDLARTPGGAALVSSSQIVVAKDQIVQCWNRWSSQAWTPTLDGGFFWYSTNPTDAYFTVNVSSMWAGVGARLLKEDWVRKDPVLAESIAMRTRQAAQTILGRYIPRQGLPYWNYIPRPNAINQDEPNDAVHHVYILWGMERVRDSEGVGVILPYSRRQAAESLRPFLKHGILFDYPQDVTYTGAQSAYTTRPMILWGTGALLAWFSAFDPSTPLLSEIQLAIARDYGSFPDLRLWPSSFSSDSKFYPRFAAHILWGQSRFAYH